MTVEDNVNIAEPDARNWTAEVFAAVGVRRGDAEVVADALVTADLRGVFSHGVLRVPIYVDRVEKGLVEACGRPTVVTEHGATALVDGANALGPVVATAAMEKAIRLASANGSGLVAVRRSNHFGTCAHYASMATKRGMIGIVATTGGTNIMAPWGGRNPLLGNNPVAVAVPAGAHPPVVLDIAMSVAARGKVLFESARGGAIPDGWALDPEGIPTTDPARAIAGTVLPMGGHKGYGLAFMIGLLAAVLPGAAFGRAIADPASEWTLPGDVGHWMHVVDISRFAEPAAFASAVDSAIDLMHGAQLAAGMSEVLVPGELEERISARQRHEGIVYPPGVAAKLDGLAARLGCQSFTAAARGRSHREQAR